MNSERSQAYGRVMKTLADIGPAKLHEGEQEVIRDAADAMFFSDDARPEVVLNRADELVTRLVAAGRLLDETAGQILSDLEDCGPGSLVASS